MSAETQEQGFWERKARFWKQRYDERERRVHASEDEAARLRLAIDGSSDLIHALEGEAERLRVALDSAIRAGRE